MNSRAAIVVFAIACCLGMFLPTSSFADDLPVCAGGQQAVDSLTSQPTAPGSQVRVTINGDGPTDALALSPETYAVTVNGGPLRSIASWQDTFQFKMPNADAVVQLTAISETIDDAFNTVPLCTEAVSLIVHAKALLAPRFKAVIDHDSNPPVLRFWLQSGSCSQALPMTTTWRMKYVGDHGGLVKVGKQRNRCRPFVLRPNWSAIARYATSHAVSPLSLDFVVQYSNAHSHRSWRFRQTYSFSRAVEIEDTDFDDYVNVCINGDYSTYASGGHLWCTVPATRTFGLRLV